MPSLAIDLDPDTLARLDAQAATHGRSAAEEARQIVEQGLGTVLADDEALSDLPDLTGLPFGEAMHALFAPLGGLDLPEPERAPLREPPDFSGPEWDPPAKP
jgi:hypothetical protein